MNDTYMHVHILVFTSLVNGSLGLIGLWSLTHWINAFKEKFAKTPFFDDIYSHKLANQAPCTMVCLIFYSWKITNWN